jgi:mono/diheme cytochrome c family protein
MNTRNIRKSLTHYGIGLGIFLGGYALVAISPWSSSEPEIASEVAGVGSVSNLQKNYERWSEGYGATEPAGPVLTMLWTRGLSSEFSKAKGIAQLNLEKETVSVRIKGLEDTAIADVWLVDNQPGSIRSVMPEQGDNMVKVGSLQFDGDKAWLDAKIAGLAEFQLDMIVLARRDGTPGQDGVLYGTTSLFQKIYHYPNHSTSWKQVAQGGFSLIRTAKATGITPPNFFSDLDSDLVNRGRDLFFNETFKGNGRSCGTCHREDDNMALGLKTIANLPDDDPLFIVEQPTRADGSPNPLYNDYRMEKPALMRKLGLILENLNGFREIDGSFTTRVNMRAATHVLSVRTTLAPPPAVAFDDGTLPVDADDLVFAERTGWSGDGTPTSFHKDFFESNGRDLTGSLRDFVIGAIIQHYPLTLDRSGLAVDEFGNPRQPDFRFATEEELDAIEAFMLSISRQQENDDLNTITLADEVADRGRLNYMGFNVFDPDPNDGRPPLNCNSCHFNGGANTDPTFAFVAGVTPNHDLADLGANGGSIPSHNRSFGPQVERLADQAGDIIAQEVDDPSVAGNCFNQGLAEVPLIPGDVAGTPSAGCDANPLDNGFAFGFDDDIADQRAANNRFNAPVVFEAVDNPPFFHGHQINTIEGAVAFYATNRHLRNGEFLPAIVPLNGAQVANVARFLRVMGADFNAASAITLSRKALGLKKAGARKTNAKLARAEVDDAIELLDPVDLHITDAVPLFRKARDLLVAASRNGNRNTLNAAVDTMEAAQSSMITRTSPGPAPGSAVPEVRQRPGKRHDPRARQDSRKRQGPARGRGRR